VASDKRERGDIGFRVPGVRNDEVDPEAAPVGANVTETFAVVALRLNRAEARESIAQMTRLFGVHLDAVEENVRALNVEYSVTVTGEADAIDAVRDGLGGRARLVAGNPLDDVLNEAMVDGVKRVQKLGWRRRRS
jgi:hypothetical protein